MDILWRSIVTQLPTGVLVIVGVGVIFFRIGDVMREVRNLKVKIDNHILWHLDRKPERSIIIERVREVDSV